MKLPFAFLRTAHGERIACSTTFFMCLTTAVSAMLLPRSLFFTIDAI